MTSTMWIEITDKISQRICTPIISNRVINSLLFGDRNIVQDWAKNNNYQLPENNRLTRVAQFLSVIKGGPARAKVNYLQTLKETLFDLAKESPQDDRWKYRSFSELAAELHYPDFERERDDPQTPLGILAALPIPVYLTTSPHRILEAALRAAGKEPCTKVYIWDQQVRNNLMAMKDTDFPNECNPNEIDPNDSRPLVYHLHGIDDSKDTLVLTEDDYFGFLVNIKEDIRNKNVIPYIVREKLTTSLLLLLGYELYAWDLRVLLQGLIKYVPSRESSTRTQSKSYAIPIQLVTSNGDDQNLRRERDKRWLDYLQQVKSEDKGNDHKNQEQLREYLEKYFDNFRFEFYEEGTQCFMETLWKEWQKRIGAPKPQFDVFLSHSSVDKPWVIKLKDALARYGVSVWLDKDQIRPGDLFAKALEDGLENSRTVALIVSPDALESGWVKEEYYRALSLAESRRPPVKIIPVILREAELPGFLQSRIWVDFQDEATYAQNVRELVWGITGKKPAQNFI